MGVAGGHRNSLPGVMVWVLFIPHPQKFVFWRLGLQCGGGRW
jgi:hypothetical protein